MSGQRHALILPLRLYYSLSTLLTLGGSCLLSSLLVCFLDHFTGLAQNLSLALTVCSAFTLLLGGIALAWDARRYIRPAEDVSRAAARVANGDFSVRVPVPDRGIAIAEAVSLIEHFNGMSRELEGMARMQKAFIANVSHEFKTPLSSIQGFTEILLDGGLDARDEQSYLALIHKEVQRLARLSENILRLSRLDAQNIVCRHERICVDEQIRRCLILLSEKCADKELLLDIDLEPMSIISDPDLLEQIWLNLIDNAQKYAKPHTSLHITGKMRDAAIYVSIRDEGPGISEEKIPHIWERFYQCEESHKEQGHGLGLSIVHSVVNFLGGTIVCKSTVGCGTEMIVEIPAVNESCKGHIDVTKGV